VRNGIVLGVEMMRDRVDLAAADEAAGTTARTQSVATMQQRSTMRTDRRHDDVFQRETRDRTGDDRSWAIGPPGKSLRTANR